MTHKLALGLPKAKKIKGSYFEKICYLFQKVLLRAAVEMKKIQIFVLLPVIAITLWWRVFDYAMYYFYIPTQHCKFLYDFFNLCNFIQYLLSVLPLLCIVSFLSLFYPLHQFFARFFFFTKPTKYQFWSRTVEEHILDLHVQFLTTNQSFFFYKQTKYF